MSLEELQPPRVVSPVWKCDMRAARDISSMNFAMSSLRGDVSIDRIESRLSIGLRNSQSHPARAAGLEFLHLDYPQTLEDVQED